MMTTTLNENPDLSPKSTDVDILQQSMLLLKKPNSDEMYPPKYHRSKYGVWQMHLTENIAHYKAQHLIELVLHGMINLKYPPTGIQRIGDTLEMTFRDPTEVIKRGMTTHGMKQGGGDRMVHWMCDDDQMLIVNIRGNEFRNRITDAVDLVSGYGKVVNYYRQSSEYRGKRFENGIITVWMTGVHTAIPTRFDKRRSCFYNKERMEEMLVHTGVKTGGVPVAKGIPPVKVAVLPSPQTGGTVVAGAASVEAPVARQVLINERGAAAASVDPSAALSVVIAETGAVAASLDTSVTRRDILKTTDAATDGSPVVVESHGVASDGERHHQCGICSKKFHSLDHLKQHALLRHPYAESDESMESIEAVRPGVERTPESGARLQTLGTKDLRGLKKKELKQRHDVKGVKKKKAGQLMKR